MNGLRSSILSAKYQFLAAFVVLLPLLNFGICIGWISPTIQLLTSDGSPLPSGAITMAEASWIASILAIGCLMGNLPYGFAMNRFGRKWPLICLAMPMIGSWFLIIFAQRVTHLYIARLIVGIVCGGILMNVPVYIVEIANHDIRGILSSVVPVGSNSGVLLAYVLGNYSNYIVTPIFAIISMALFAIVFSFLPETPIFLVKKNRISEAKKSLQFYRSLPTDDDESILSEIEMLKEAIGAFKQNNERHLQWRDFTSKTGKRAMSIATVLALLSHLSGVSVMDTYTATIFEASGSTFSPNTSTMIVGAVKLIGTFVVIPLIDIVGRRYLYIISCIGTAAAQIVLGIYMMLSFHKFDVEAYNWIPIVAYGSALFLLALAITSLTFTVIAEIMPEKLKDFGLAYTGVVTSLTAFTVVKCLPMLSDAIGFHGCMFLFAMVCLLGVTFIITILPETKGKRYEEMTCLLEEEVNTYNTNSPH